MRKTALERIREQKLARAKPKELDFLGLYSLLLGGPPNPTQLALVSSMDEELAYMGAAGAAKTSAICALGWLMCLLEPGYRLLVARADFNDLKDTTAKRMDEMLGRLPEGTLVDRSKAAPMQWWVRPIGTSDELSQITFMGLQVAPRSYEFNGAIIDEADEVDSSVFQEVRSRLRLKGKTRKLALAFNPPSEDHWLYTECTGLDAKGRVVQSPPNLRLFTPNLGENAHNLGDGYYDTLRRTLPPDLVARLVEGKWGSTFVGQPVYGDLFKRAWHCKTLTEYDKHRPMLRFWDFGFRWPVCLYAQVTYDGILKIYREEIGQDIEIEPFALKCTSISRLEFPDATEWLDYGDPAARQKKDTGSTLAVLAKPEVGITLRYRLEGIRPGINACRYHLARTIGGGPAIVIDKRCTMLIRVLEGGYHYPDNGARGNPELPVKDGYYDHTADAFRYGVTNIYGSVGNIDPKDAAERLSGASLPPNLSAGYYK